MYSNCPWLPAMAQVDPWTATTYEMLYDIFRRDFVESRPTYQGHEIWHFPEMEDGKLAVFWHLTTREVKPTPIPRRKDRFAASMQQQFQRYPDLRRSERLPWARAMLKNCGQLEVCAWDYLEGSGNIHTYVWLGSYDFVVIMKKYPDGRRRLITSFHVDSDYKRKDFERKYANRLV